VTLGRRAAVLDRWRLRSSPRGLACDDAQEFVREGRGRRIAGRCPSLQRLRHLFGQGHGGRVEVEPDRAECGSGQATTAGVVDTDHGEVVGRLKAADAQAGEDKKAKVVVVGADRTDRGLRLEPALDGSGGVSNVPIEPAHHGRGEIGLSAGSLHPRESRGPEELLQGVGGGREAEDLVSEIDEVAGLQIADLVLVDPPAHAVLATRLAPEHSDAGV
jgi:hypothetical protein